MLGRTALLYLDQNREGNLEPHAEFSDAETDLHTKEDRATHGIQYLFSALGEDLPPQEDTENLCPTPEEIILTLDDSGDEGRLFKLDRF